MLDYDRRSVCIQCTVHSEFSTALSSVSEKRDQETFPYTQSFPRRFQRISGRRFRKRTSVISSQQDLHRTTAYSADYRSRVQSKANIYLIEIVPDSSDVQQTILNITRCCVICKTCRNIRDLMHSVIFYLTVYGVRSSRGYVSDRA
jgi:hypothetical protein